MPARKGIPDEEVLAAVEEHQPAGTSTIATALGIERQGADYRLRKLRDDGHVIADDIGGSLAWSLDTDG
jgi:predicted transcriptional regulator